MKTSKDSSQQVDGYIQSFTDWRGKCLAQLRQLINETATDAEEEWKWNCPVWTQNSLLVAISGFKSHVKLNFLKGASLKDPKGLFNSGLDSKSHRSINFGEGDPVDIPAIKALVLEAVAHNTDDKTLR